MVALPCPSCGDVESVIRYGHNDSGSERMRCKACETCFTPQPRSRALTPEKAEQIEGCLAERMSQRGHAGMTGAIARALGVSRDTVRAVRRKPRSGS